MVFRDHWGWPLLTVCILEVFWHMVFRVGESWWH